MLITLVSLLLAAQTASAAEPAYCSLRGFAAHEISSPVRGLERVHAYRLGQVVIAGLGIGLSDPEDVRALAQSLGRSGPEQGYCTWYLNDGNDAAAEIFNWHDMRRPQFMLPATAAREAWEAVGSSLDQDPVSWLSCARDTGYIAMGCDGMRHRGPGIFGMMLSFSGCTPEHSLEIVNKIWGSNFIPNANRLAIIRKGYEYGEARPESRQALQALFTAE